VFVLGLCVQGVADGGSYLPFRVFFKGKAIGYVVVRSFDGFFSDAVQFYKLFVHVFLGSCVSLGCSKGKLGGTGFGTWLDLSEGGVDVGVRELYEVLIGIDLLFLLLGLHFLSHPL
jgi:hypothetical protein